MLLIQIHIVIFHIFIFFLEAVVPNFEEASLPTENALENNQQNSIQFLQEVRLRRRDDEAEYVGKKNFFSRKY